jgi:hypothetical protein
LGRLLVGWLLGFRGRERVVQMRHRGTRPPSRGASTAGGGAHGWRRRGGPPAPTARARDKARKGKKSQERGLTGWAHMAAREEERWVIAGPAGCVGPQG